MPPRRRPLMELLENDATTSNATDKRRVSGRTVRAPDKFIPDAPSSQPRNTGAKRKRGADIAPEDIENEEVEEEESDEDVVEESTDEEEVRQTKRKAKTTNKPVPKKAKVNGTAAQASVPAVKLPNRRKKTKKVVMEDTLAEGLYAEIFTSGDSPDDVAAQWLKRYEVDNTASMTDLVNCILKSSGCEMKVTEDDVNDPDNIPSKLNDMQDEYKGQNIADYPLISKAKSSHAFRVSLTEFFESLIANLHASDVLYDDIALIENIQLWVTTMSSSFLRPFRHTATVVALAITTALCHVAKKLAESTANSLRQLEGEKKKKGANRSTIAAFQRQVNQGNERSELCDNALRDFFDTVFVHRYRDVDPKIRTDCVEALGHWVTILPKTFKDGAFLRYLGWMLSDTSAPTRHEAVKQLEKILKKNIDEIGGLRDFIERFRPRIVEMAARDSDTGVRVSAIDFLDIVREAGMLEPDDIDVIGKLIFDFEARVRKAIVGFFVENINDSYEAKMEELGGEETLNEAFPTGGKNDESPRREWIKLKCLAEIFLSYDSGDHEELPSQIEAAIDSGILTASGVESRFSLAAQALYDKMPEIKEWEALAGYLLFDHSAELEAGSASADIHLSVRNSFKLDEREEAILLEILEAAVKLSLKQPDDHDKAKDRAKKKLSKMEVKELQSSTARRLAIVIPRLLNKFGANPKTTAAVLRLEQALDLGVFQELRIGTTAYGGLLHEIGVQFKGHADHRVLNEASAALLHAREFEDLEEVTEESMQSLWDDTVKDMRKRVQAYSKSGIISARGNLSTEHLSELASSVARVSKLTSILDPIPRFEKSLRGGSRGDMVPIDILIELVSRGVLMEADAEIDDIEDGLVTSACRSALFYFMWKARSLQQLVAATEAIPDLDIDRVRDRVQTFASGLVNVLSSRGGLDDLRLFATGTLLDLRILFSTLIPAKTAKGKDDEAGIEIDNGNHYAYLKSLVHEIEPEVQEELTSIFAGAEKQYAKKAKKTLEAPADDDEPEDIDSDSEEDEEDDITDADRKSDALKAEQKLCELTGKLVLGILAGIIDASGPLKGKLRTRIQRNRNKLGPNFKEVVAYLDHDKTKGEKKSHKSKAQQTAAAAHKSLKSAEMVEEDEEGVVGEEMEDAFVRGEWEEDTVQDLRRRELLDDDAPVSVDDDGDNEALGEDDEDDIMGD